MKKTLFVALNVFFFYIASLHAATTTKPMVMIIFDNSGSMNAKRIMNLHATDFYVDEYHGYNYIYYNPDITYDAWVGYPDANHNNPEKDPKDGDNTNILHMNSIDFTVDGHDIYNAHFILRSENGSYYLVNLDKSIKYYKLLSWDNFQNDKGNWKTRLTSLTSTASPPADITERVEDGSKTYDYHRQNFANWYRYYSTRLLTAKSEVGKMVNKITGATVGYFALDDVSQRSPVIDIDVQANKDWLIEAIYSIRKESFDTGTPLRTALQSVGRYYDATDSNTGGIGTSPYDPGGIGECQPAFCVMMSDGFWNGDDPSVGNADAGKGHPFEDSYSDTLADVAMYYHERDLSSLDGQQGMITYTIGFGVEGSLTFNPACSEKNPSACPSSWPSTSGKEGKIDDIWHTAVNGRGKYWETNDAKQLEAAFEGIITEIHESESTIGGAPVTYNTQEVAGETHVYKCSYETETWTGNVQAYEYSLNDGAYTIASGKTEPEPIWSAQEELDKMHWDSDRIIFTKKEDSTVAFRWDTLSDAQRIQLEAQLLLRYLRGNKNLETNGTYRPRTHILGDVIHSAPVQNNGIVYVGANDGMLHAFNATTGREIFAYVPNLIFDGLAAYAKHGYEHTYFVDATPSISNIGTKSYLVGGLGHGGRGYYGIDITDATMITDEANTTTRPAVWEYPSPAGSDHDMGYSVSEASIVLTNYKINGVTQPLAIVPNGYDSPNGNAVLYAIDMTGTVKATINTNVGNSTTKNGLSTPVVIDSNFDGTADYAYAGDLYGNLWKFDLTNNDPSKWEVYFDDGNGAKLPLFRAADKSGTPQPITSRPDIMMHPYSSQASNGYMVVFGTGKFLSKEDLNDTSTQTLYGIWDWSDAWDAMSGVISTDKSLGSPGIPAGTPLVRKLSAIQGSSYFDTNAKATLTLLEQRQTTTEEATGWFQSTDNLIQFFEPETYNSNKASYHGGHHVGWYMDLPDTGERIISAPQIRGGFVVAVSMIPGASATCASEEVSGTSYIYALNAYNGGMSETPFFDTNGDNEAGGKDDRPMAGKKLEGIQYSPALIGLLNKTEITFGPNITITGIGEVSGIISWRFFK